MLIRSYLLFLLVISLPQTALADSLRCGTKLVVEGESKFEVINKCGKPAHEEDAGYLKIHDAYVKVIKLYYDLGDGHMLQILEFRNDKLVSIVSGARN